MNTTSSLQQLYTERLAEFTRHLKEKKRSLFFLSMVRLITFLLLILFIYLFLGNLALLGISLVLGISVFLFLLVKYQNLAVQKKQLEALISINQTELNVLAGDYKNLPTGKIYSNALHHYSEDIDLFGKNSFYQYLNRTSLKEGSDKLADLLTANQTLNIIEKQQAIAELSKKIDYRQEFSAKAKLVTTEVSNKSLLNWLENYTPFIPKIHLWLPRVFGGISILLLIAYFGGFISGYIPSGWFFVGLAITGSKLKKINLLGVYANESQKSFQQYYKLLALVEAQDFKADLLTELQEKLSSKNQKSSKKLQQFSKIIDAFEQRNNMLFGVVGNGFLLWDLHYTYKLEKWISANSKEVKQWFAVLETLDAYHSLGNFAFNHPNYCFPSLNSTNQHILEVKNTVHPLINAATAITNSFTIAEEEFLIVTGANMAGKSTFLRTVSLLIVMANTGLPVRAESCNYKPIKLITSMRTSDSLADDSSYFFAELSRLKFLVEELKNNQYFIVLDEILKGTNSKDKAEGSEKFIEKLSKQKATGIIATHDLSLCKLAERYPHIHNYYFDAEIINDELSFDYTLKKGVCKNMNASFLLRKMNIIDQ